MSNLDKNEELKRAFDALLNTSTSLKRKKKNTADRKREIFLQIINMCESVITREILLTADFKLNFTSFNMIKRNSKIESNFPTAGIAKLSGKKNK